MGIPAPQAIEGGFRTLKKVYPEFTKEQLINSIDGYIKIIENERETGKKECNTLKNEITSNNTQKIQELIAQKKDLEDQLINIKSLLSDIDTQIDTTSKEVEKRTVELTHKEQVFENSVNFVIEDLMSDKQLIINLNI